MMRFLIPLLLVLKRPLEKCVNFDYHAIESSISTYLNEQITFFQNLIFLILTKTFFDKKSIKKF